MKWSVSLKKATKKTNIKHNNRTMSEKEKERNTHIDYSRSDRNKYLVQEDIKKLYEQEFGEALKKYNAKQKRKDRKIDDYYKHIQSSKKTATQQEMIIQVGDMEDFENINNWEIANEVLEEWFEGFQERNPNLKVYNAVIHNDEASPHLHVNFVPVASGYKRGLEKQVSFDRAIKQQDPTLNATRPFDDWREKEVQVLEQLLLERGIERKLVGTNEFRDVNEFKEKQNKLRELEVKVDTELAKLGVFEEDKKEKDEDEVKPIVALSDYKRKPELSLKKTLTGKYTVEPEEIKELMEYVSCQEEKNQKLQKELDERNDEFDKLRKVYLRDRKQIDKLVDERLVLERQKWSREQFEYQREVNNLSNYLETLENENKALRDENERLRVWKDKATQFMQKANVFERFRSWISNLNKNRVQDFER